MLPKGKKKLDLHLIMEVESLNLHLASLAEMRLRDCFVR